MMLSLDMDRAFQDFNFSALVDPTLKSRLPQARLYELVYQARQSPRDAGDFADVMYWTLREATFECFQRIHGPRPIQYREWFYAKLTQLLDILVYEQLSVDGIVTPEGKWAAPQTDRPWKEGSYVLGSTGEGPEPEDLERAFGPEDVESFDWVGFVRELCEAGNQRGAVLADLLYSRAKVRGHHMTSTVFDSESRRHQGTWRAI
jgi:hypothetical protein